MLMNDADATNYTPQRRRRSGFALRILVLLLLGAASAGCAGSVSTLRGDSVPVVATPEAEVTADTSPAPQASPAAPQESAAADTATTPRQEPTEAPAAIAVADTELPPAPIGFDSLFETDPSGPLPVAIAIESIDVQGATIIPVGVNQQDLSFEVPPADQVGWYEFGPVPGQSGSAVLAAHIAYNGVDGVFRYLEDVEIGSVVVVSFDDGTSQRYRIEEVTEYIKEELPESVFARDGKEQLALITCGGAFNYQLDSYESNTVAIAVPVA